MKQIHYWGPLGKAQMQRGVCSKHAVGELLLVSQRQLLRFMLGHHLAFTMSKVLSTTEMWPLQQMIYYLFAFAGGTR